MPLKGLDILPRWSLLPPIITCFWLLKMVSCWPEKWAAQLVLPPGGSHTNYPYPNHHAFWRNRAHQSSNVPNHVSVPTPLLCESNKESDRFKYRQILAESYFNFGLKKLWIVSSLMNINFVHTLFSLIINDSLIVQICLNGSSDMVSLWIGRIIVYSSKSVISEIFLHALVK